MHTVCDNFVFKSNEHFVLSCTIKTLSSETGRLKSRLIALLFACIDECVVAKEKFAIK